MQHLNPAEVQQAVERFSPILRPCAQIQCGSGDETRIAKQPSSKVYVSAQLFTIHDRNSKEAQCS